MSIVNGVRSGYLDRGQLSDPHVQFAAMLLEQESEQSAAERENRHTARVQRRAALAAEIQAIDAEARTLIAGAAVSGALTAGGGAAKLTGGAQRVDAAGSTAEAESYSDVGTQARTKTDAAELAAGADVWCVRGDVAIGLAQPASQLSEGMQRKHQADAAADRGAQQDAQAAEDDARDAQVRLAKFSEGVLDTLAEIQRNTSDTSKYIVRG